MSSNYLCGTMSYLTEKEALESWNSCAIFRQDMLPAQATAHSLHYLQKLVADRNKTAQERAADEQKRLRLEEGREAAAALARKLQLLQVKKQDADSALMPSLVEQPQQSAEGKINVKDDNDNGAAADMERVRHAPPTHKDDNFLFQLAEADETTLDMIVKQEEQDELDNLRRREEMANALTQQQQQQSMMSSTATQPQQQQSLLPASEAGMRRNRGDDQQQQHGVDSMMSMQHQQQPNRSAVRRLVDVGVLAMLLGFKVGTAERYRGRVNTFLLDQGYGFVHPFAADELAVRKKKHDALLVEHSAWQARRFARDQVRQVARQKKMHQRQQLQLQQQQEEEEQEQERRKNDALVSDGAAEKRVEGDDGKGEGDHQQQQQEDAERKSKEEQRHQLQLALLQKAQEEEDAAEESKDPEPYLDRTALAFFEAVNQLPIALEDIEIYVAADDILNVSSTIASALMLFQQPPALFPSSNNMNNNSGGDGRANNGPQQQQQNEHQHALDVHRATRALCMPTSGEEIEFCVSISLSNHGKSLRAVQVTGPGMGPLVVQMPSMRQKGLVRMWDTTRRFGFLSPISGPPPRLAAMTSRDGTVPSRLPQETVDAIKRNGDVFVMTSNVLWESSVGPADRSLQVGTVVEFTPVLRRAGAKKDDQQQQQQNNNQNRRGGGGGGRDNNNSGSAAANRITAVGVTDNNYRPVLPEALERSVDTNYQQGGGGATMTGGHDMAMPNMMLPSSSSGAGAFGATGGAGAGFLQQQQQQQQQLLYSAPGIIQRDYHGSSSASAASATFGSIDVAAAGLSSLNTTTTTSRGFQMLPSMMNAAAGPYSLSTASAAAGSNNMSGGGSLLFGGGGGGGGGNTGGGLLAAPTTGGGSGAGAGNAGDKSAGGGAVTSISAMADLLDGTTGW